MPKEINFDFENRQGTSDITADKTAKTPLQET